jgi:hypothetical protein
MGRHVVRALGRVDIASVPRRQTIEGTQQIPADIRIGILLDQERGRGVAAENGQKPVPDAGAGHPSRHRIRDLGEALTPRVDAEPSAGLPRDPSFGQGFDPHPFCLFGSLSCRG